MPILTDTDPTGRLYGSTSRVHKVKQSPSRGSARTSSSASAAATASCRNWPESASEISSASLDHDGLGIRLIPARPLSDDDCCLACPYAKHQYLLAAQMVRQSGGRDGKRCWSKSYPNISRLKYAISLRKLLITCPADDTVHSGTDNTCIAPIVGQNLHVADARRNSPQRKCLTLTAVRCQCVTLGKLGVLGG